MNKATVLLAAALVISFFSTASLSSDKIQSPLRRLIEEKPRLGTDDFRKACRDANVKLLPSGKITVITELEEGKIIDAGLLKPFSAVLAYRYGNLMEISVPVDQLEPVASAFPEINLLRPPYINCPLDVTEGLSLTGSDVYNNDGYRGQGIKVAVIDGGFTGLAQAQASGELPDNAIVYDYTGRGIESDTNHGTGVAEIIYDLAPDAQLYLMKVDNETELGNAKDQCKTLGVRVINHSVGWFNSGPGDGTGIVCNIVADARNNGILWVNAAGNQAQGHWEGPFNDVNGDKWHDFTPTDNSNSVTTSGQMVIILRWNDKWTRSNQDYDLYVYDDAGREIGSSKNRQNGTVNASPPTESLSISTGPGTYDIRVYNYSTNKASVIELFSYNNNFEYIVSTGSLVQPADSNSAIAVCAVSRGSWATGPQEPYSSMGPTKDGRIKPDIAGPDGVTNPAYGYFYGTSASAPHVAGALALILSRNTAYTADLAQQKMTNDAVDMGAAGKDNIYGYGRLNVKLNPPQVSNPLCEGSANPVNLTQLSPRFSWTVSDADPSDAQSAAEIIVSGNYQNILLDTGDKWDSGKIISANSNILYSGQPLDSTTYYWKVKLWDRFNSTGTFCAVQSFNIRDSSPPAAVSDLSAYAGFMPGSVRLKWTAPGDDGLSGDINGGSFELTYSTAPDMSSSLLTSISTSCAVSVLQSYEQFNLAEGMTYYFVLRTIDDAMNWSADSNKASCFVMSNNPPDAPAGLLCEGKADPVSVANFTPVLSWTFSDPDITDTQKAYQLLVSSIQDYLDSGTGSMWDTGIVNSPNNSAVYEGSPLLPGDTYYWKVKCWDTYNSAGAYAAKAKFCMFNIVMPGITVISPDGAQTWGVNTTQTIRWTSQGNIGNVDINISLNGTAGPWVTLTGNTLNDGAESVLLPGNPSASCRIKVADVSGTPQDISSADFTLSAVPPQPDITVLYPDGGEILIFGQQYAVVWTSQGAVNNIDIEISCNGTSGPWESLVSGTVNDGNEIVTIPSVATQAGRIRVKDVSGAPSDISNNNFSIIDAAGAIINVSTGALNFGEILVGERKTLYFDIRNTGAGALTGSIACDNNWVIVNPASFNLGSSVNDNSARIEVTVDNNLFYKDYGKFTAKVKIFSSVGYREVQLVFIATCVLVKPNPVSLGMTGEPVKLTFFGDGIVPGQTTIKIYTLSGELIDVISQQSTVDGPQQKQKNYGLWTVDSGHPSITWAPSNLSPGIYIYTYESPKEKGVGKFTVIR